MTWHYNNLENSRSSPEQGEESWEDSCLDGAPESLLRLIPTADPSCSPDNGTESLSHFRSGMKSKHSTDTHGEDELTWFQGGFPASISAPREVQIARDSTEKRVGSGRRWPESFARYNHDSHSWRIPQQSLFGDSEEFLETWPRWGSMHDGECSALGILAHDTSVKECGSLPRIGTPIACQRSRSAEFMGGRVPNPFEICPRGYLPSPAWVENIMGWISGWTDLKPLGMDKYQRWLDSHGKSFKEE